MVAGPASSASTKMTAKRQALVNRDRRDDAILAETVDQQLFTLARDTHMQQDIPAIK
jgi:hypothetical protein